MYFAKSLPLIAECPIVALQRPAPTLVQSLKMFPDFVHSILAHVLILF